MVKPIIKVSRVNFFFLDGVKTYIFVEDISIICN